MDRATISEVRSLDVPVTTGYWPRRLLLVDRKNPNNVEEKNVQANSGLSSSKTSLPKRDTRTSTLNREKSSFLASAVPKPEKSKKDKPLSSTAERSFPKRPDTLKTETNLAHIQVQQAELALKSARYKLQQLENEYKRIRDGKRKQLTTNIASSKKRITNDIRKCASNAIPVQPSIQQNAHKTQVNGSANLCRSVQGDITSNNQYKIPSTPVSTKSKKKSTAHNKTKPSIASKHISECKQNVNQSVPRLTESSNNAVRTDKKHHTSTSYHAHGPRQFKTHLPLVLTKCDKVQAVHTDKQTSPTFTKKTVTSWGLAGDPEYKNQFIPKSINLRDVNTSMTSLQVTKERENESIRLKDHLTPILNDIKPGSMSLNTIEEGARESTRPEDRVTLELSKLDRTKPIQIDIMVPKTPDTNKSHHSEIHLVETELKKMKEMPKCSELVHEICLFASSVRSSVKIIMGFNKPEYLHSLDTVVSLIEKLPTILKWRCYDYLWASHAVEKYSDLGLFSKYLDQEANKCAHFAIMRKSTRNKF